MESERTHIVEESTAQSQGGIIMKVNLTEREKFSNFCSLQFDFQDQPTQKEYDRNEVIKYVAIEFHVITTDTMCYRIVDTVSYRNRL